MNQEDSDQAPCASRALIAGLEREAEDAARQIVDTAFFPYGLRSRTLPPFGLQLAGTGRSSTGEIALVSLWYGSSSSRERPPYAKVVTMRPAMEGVPPLASPADLAESESQAFGGAQAVPERMVLSVNGGEREVTAARADPCWAARTEVFGVELAVISVGITAEEIELAQLPPATIVEQLQVQIRRIKAMYGQAE